jgi:RNase H-fold protein (predicted Holliday junction resolvase)
MMMWWNRIKLSAPNPKLRLKGVQALGEAGKEKAAKPLLDAVAAQLILQTWLESTPHVVS